jgi:hypothetical protein
MFIGLALTQTPNQKGFFDKNGSELRVTGFDQWSIEKMGKGTYQLTMTGRPHAEWLKQGLDLKAKSLEMVASGDYKLISAELKGGVEFSSEKSGSNGRVEVKTQTATYTEADEKLVVSGGLVLDQTGEANGQVLHAEGSSGTVFLDRKGSDRDLIKSATLSGPIKFKLSGMREDDEAKKKVPFFVNATAGVLTYAKAEKKIVLKQNVKIDGNDPSIFGEISGVHTVTLFLSEAGEITKIVMEGDPGSTKIEQKSKGGGGGK